MTTVGLAGELRLGKQRSPKWHFGPNMRPYLRVANVFEDRIDVSDVKSMHFEPQEIEAFTLRPGDVLLNEGQSPEFLGRPAIYRDELPGACFTNSLIRFRPYEGVLNTWALAVFRHHMRSGRFRQESRITTNIAHLSLGRLASVEFPVPPTAEQRRIVDVIEGQTSRLDDAEGLLRSARRRTATLRAAVLRAVGSASVEFIPLGEIAEVVGGVTKDSRRQGGPAYVEVPYLRVANVQRGFLDLHDVSTIRVPPEKAKSLRLEPGDILFNEGGDRDKLGRGWVWKGQLDDCIHQNHVFRARLQSAYFDPKFVSIYGNSAGQGWFEQQGKQTTNLASINLKTLKSFPIPLVPLDEQRILVAEAERQLTILDSLAMVIDHACVRSEHLRSSILSRAVSGQLVPQEARDEPASELLDRIASGRDEISTSKRRQGR